MDRFTNLVLSAERKRNIAQPAGDQHAGALVLDLARSLDEIHSIIVVFRDTCRHGKNIGVENNVLGRKANFLRQDAPGSFADGNPLFQAVCLALLVKCHHDDGRTVTKDGLCLLDEWLPAFFEADRINDPLALQALQPGIEHLPAGGIDHDWYPGDIRLGCDQVQEARHRFGAVQKAFVHVDVDDLGAILNLLQSHLQGFSVVVFGNQAFELRRPGHIGAFTHIDEIQFRRDGQGFQSGQAAARFQFGNFSWPCVFNRGGNRRNVLGSCATATSDDIEQALIGKFCDHRSHVFRRIVIFAQLIGQPRVGIKADRAIRDPGQFHDPGPDFPGAQGTVQTDCKGPGVPDGVPECFNGLAG